MLETGLLARHELADAFTEVVHRETPRLLAIALSILDDPPAAEDAVQDALLQAWRSWDSLRDPACRQAWLVRICVRRCLRLRERLNAKVRQETEVASIELRPDHSQDNDRTGFDLTIEWAAAYRRLSNSQRAVVTLHYHYGYTLDDSAVAMGCRPGTVRRHLSRALEKLRKEVLP